jgi:hypothetical protein
MLARKGKEEKKGKERGSVLGEGGRLGGGRWPGIVRGHPCKQSFFPQNVWSKWKEKENKKKNKKRKGAC